MSTAKTWEFSPELNGFSGLLHFSRDPLGALDEARRLHGPFVGYVQGKETVRILMGAELIDELLVRHPDRLEKDVYTKALRPVLGLSLLTDDGDPWKARRKLLAPSFQPQHIRSYASTMVSSTDEAMSSWGADEIRNISDDMMSLTLEIVVRTLFGTGAVRTDEIGRVLEVAMADFRRLHMSFRAALPPWVPLWSRRRFHRARSKLADILMQVIQARQEAPLNSDMLSRLLEVRDESGAGMTQEQLLDECLTIVLAGHETTALSLAYTLDLLAQHPQVRLEVEAELATILQGDKPSLEQVKELRVVRGLVRESLRLFPPVWAAGRIALSDFTLAGSSIAARTQLIVSPWVVQRDPRYFSRPLEFRPERWWNGETDDLPKGTYLPFGAGPRVCIGQHFAELELTLALARLLQAYDFERLDSKPLEFSPSVTLRPRAPICLRVRRRPAQATSLAGAQVA